MSERRNTTRVRSLLKGRILYNHGQASMDCIVRNYSSDGARLEVSAVVTLPDEFDLYIPQRAETRQARIRWRRGDEIGVSLRSGEAAAPPPAEDGAMTALLKRFVALEAENADLRRQLDEARAALIALSNRAA